MNTENKTEAFREVLKLLLKNSLLLSFKEKQDFIDLLPLLDEDELLELFGLLVKAKENVDNILGELTTQYPQIVDQLSSYQKKALKSIFKYERDVLKTKLT